jgi:UrcA family protein
MKTAIKTRAKSTALILAAGFLAFACAAASGKAHADDQQPPLRKIVVFGDLNLDSDQGAKVLYSRLRGAARDVCLPLQSRSSLTNDWRRCYDDALASAVAQVNTVRVTALHNRSVRHAAKS